MSKGLIDDKNVFLQKLIVIILSIIYGILVSFYLIFSAIKNRSNYFYKKKRDVPPQCLNDPSLGVEHRMIKLKVRIEGIYKINAKSLIQFLEKDVKLHYVCGGDPSKQLMLFVHGFPEFWYSWRYQLQEFSKDYFVVAIDQRGYGDSDKPNGAQNYTPDKMVDDIRQLLEALNKENVILMGHDWGGVVSWIFAAKYGGFLDKLIILNAAHPLHMRVVLKKSLKQFIMSWYMLFFNLPLLPEFALKSNDYYIFDSGFRRGSGQPLCSSDELEAYKYTIHKNSFTCPLNYYRATIRQYPSSPPVSYQIKMPTLVIWGKKDKYLSSELAKPYKYVDDLDVKYIEDGSHFIPMEEPLLVNQYIRQFLRK